MRAACPRGSACLRSGQRRTSCQSLRAYALSQQFIDARYQGRGYGTEAVRLLLQGLKADGKFGRVVLCYVDGDEPAKRLYEKLGFRHTGEVEEDGIVMERML